VSAHPATVSTHAERSKVQAVHGWITCPRCYRDLRAAAGRVGHIALRTHENPAGVQTKPVLRVPQHKSQAGRSCPGGGGIVSRSAVREVA
jgi:hypothetical protein